MLRCLGKHIFPVLLLLNIATAAQIKSRKDKKLYLKADNAFEYGDYFTALKLYKSLYPLDSTSKDINYKLGVCCFELKKFRGSAKSYFEKASADKYPETNYYLGILNHLQHNYERSVLHYHDYMHSTADNKEHSNKEIEDLIEKCHTANVLESTPDETVKIENLGATVNSEFAEYAPLIPADETFLIFTSRRKNPVYPSVDPLGDYFEDIYISTRKDSVWQLPTVLDTSINKAYHDAATGLSADGEKLLSYHTSPDHIHGHIYESKLIVNKWTDPVLLDANVNSADYVETSACYSPDGEMIFFSSNRPGGFGGKDLYSVKKLPNGKWAMAQNLGPEVNTVYNEDAPFVHPSEKVLFFSSEGHKNMGGYDVFKSLYDGQGSYTAPKNLGYPINTVDDDIFFVLNTDASIGYFSSQRSGGFGSQDIYKAFFEENNIPLFVYNVYVKDEKDEIINHVDIIVTDKEKKEVFGEYKSNPNSGKAIIISKPDKTYRITIQSKGYEPLVLNSITLGGQTTLTFKMVHKTHE